MQENQTITTTDHISEQLNHINNLTILYNHQWPSSQLILSIQGYYNQFKMSLIEQAQQGIGINLSQPFLEMKIKANLRVNYAQNQQEEFQSKLRKKGHLVQLRTGISWQISPAQVIRLEGLVLSNKGSNIDHFQERKVGMSYQAKLQKKKQ